MPLLFFTRRLLQWRGVDTLNLNPAARSDAFQKSSDDEQLAWLKADVLAGLKKGLEQKTYLGIVLAGKSIGSLAIAQAVSQAEALLPTAIVWLTPLLRYPVVVDAALAANGPQVHLCGGAVDLKPESLNGSWSETARPGFYRPKSRPYFGDSRERARNLRWDR